MADRASDANAARWVTHLVQFNLHPVKSAHRSWFPSALSQVVFDADGRLGDRVGMPVSQWLLGEADAAGSSDWQMEEPEKRIWMLDPPSLEQLAFDLAAVAHRDSIAQMIDRERVQVVQRALGSALWSFVLEDVPERLRLFTSRSVDFDRATPAVLKTSLRAEGVRWLFGLLAPEWRAVRARATLRFEASLTRDVPPLLDVVRRNRLVDLIRDPLIARRLPQWAWLL